ncbi:hypothetical protein FAF44_50670 [Nonomuraea sp. MG754425]|uniref:hypothetical protein n=1 Tax=Nonomuraea sp. MG754425 TaxID=2570319 RepID=UPI001F445C67|nr:hypothetical protein [Nonomuraea sp. MG754425]MCF6476542.1 hypothetical protein [Nonomuraea sp. MG754425]
MLRTPALIGIAIGASPVTTAPAVATAKPAEPPSGLLAAVQRDPGRTKEHPLDRPADASRGDAAAVPGPGRRPGDRFAGTCHEGADIAEITHSGAGARGEPRSPAEPTAAMELPDRTAPPACARSRAVAVLTAGGSSISDDRAQGMTSSGPTYHRTTTSGDEVHIYLRKWNGASSAVAGAPNPEDSYDGTTQDHRVHASSGSGSNTPILDRP